MEENGLSLSAELEVGEDEVVLVKEGVVDAHRLLLPHSDEELTMQQHELVVDLELHGTMGRHHNNCI